MPTTRSPAGLDWVNFVAAAVQPDFGPVIAIYLTLHHWTGLAIGGVLSPGRIVSMVSQIPAGAIGLLAIGASALLFVFTPTQFGVSVAEILRGFASCMLNPTIAAISLALVSRRVLERDGFRSIGFADQGLCPWTPTACRRCR